MSNMNTFAGVYNLAGPISTVETAVAIPGSTTVRQLLAPPQDIATGVLDGRMFRVRAVAKAVGTGAGNFTFNLYFNFGANTNLTTFTSDVLIVGNGTVAVASKTAVSTMSALLFWDSTLQQLSGVKEFVWNSIVTTPTLTLATPAVTATQPLSATTVTTNVSGIQVFATITCSANITSTTLTELSFERI